MANYLSNKIEKYIVLFSPFIVLLCYKVCSVFHIKTICLWKLLTGHECWGCGITTAIIQVLKGDFNSAMETNWRVVIVLPILLYAWITFIIKNKELFCFKGEKNE